MRRILLLSFPYASALGGGERYAERLTEGLLAQGARVTLVGSSRALLGTFRRRGWDRLPLWAGLEPVSKASILFFLPTLPLFLPIILALLVAFRLRGARQVICLAFGEKLLATLPARLLGMRVIWMEHLVPGRALLQNPYRFWYAAMSRLATVACVSEAVAAPLAGAGVPRGRIRIIPPGIEASDAEACERGASQIIGCLSRLHKEKNVAMLIEAFARVSKELTEARLEICGEGPERAALEKQAMQLGLSERVTFRGYVSDAGKRAGRYRILAVPSAEESFGISALEAMACGVPVVAARVGGLPELIEDGETGLLTPPADAASFAAALLSLLRDPERAAALGAEGRRQALERFSLSKMRAAWNSLLS